MNNILNQQFNTPYQTPPFNEIQPELFLPAIKEAIKLGITEVREIIENSQKPDFSNTIEALEKTGKQLSRISSILFNMNAAETSDAIQKAAREVSPLLSEYANDIWLNEALFEKVKSVYSIMGTLKLSEEQQTLLDKTYKGFIRKGALLDEKQKKRYRQITNELSQLSIQFGENLLAETNDYKLHITKEEELSGLPEAVVEAAAHLAKNEGKEGWMFSLHITSFMPFMKYADNRKLREQLFRAYSSRCNHDNKHDNKEIILKQTALRLEKAQLLGFKTHAHYVLEERMAQTPEKVNDFLEELYSKSFEYAKNDIEEVKAFAKNEGFNEELQRWDFAYYSEKLKTARFQLDDEMTKPYFQLEKVKHGIFNLTNKMWGLSYKRNDKIPLYHSDVEAWEVYDENDDMLSILYLDFHPRKSKQGGAWMTSFRDQHVENGMNVLPQISVVCNFTEPTPTRPSLLTYSELTTFLHEFGHALHGMLSKVNYESLSGTSVYHDFVELPSQIMENWAREKEWLQEIGIHYQTGEPIPEELINNILASGNFQSGYQIIRQLSFGFNDMAWHTITEPVKSNPVEFEHQAMKRTELFPLIEGTCMSTAFGHIFDGGYASGYYGYKWAEVLDADAYTMFKTHGIYDKTIAGRLRETILSKGGTIHPMELYKSFRGQEPSIEPLLERSGITMH
ncbi:M3 family metallopeptidase [Natronoflexus pectinivorans]|uniref:Peptidyl-dipeptidase Dcp n=1 Tax=Natronoflexus pectinivorans TaxID=682526 RepID=A0A4R2GJ73_9BACT|nr:M3 family metallopeptidase [Natronoflexus pectinivorans]TCO08771.1 peptidyl-dipeptidase Dcp [Natronoflexus pectinivorans]